MQVGVDGEWGNIMRLRDQALLALEQDLPRQEGTDKKINTLDVGVEALVDEDTARTLTRFAPVDLADLLGVSIFQICAFGSAVLQLILQY